MWQSSSKRYKKLQFCSILQYKNRLSDVRKTWNLECTFLTPVILFLKDFTSMHQLFYNLHPNNYKKTTFFSISQHLLKKIQTECFVAYMVIYFGVCRRVGDGSPCRCIFSELGQLKSTVSSFCARDGLIGVQIWV